MRRMFLKSGLPCEEIEQLMVIRHLREKYPTALFTIAPNGMRLPMSVAVRLKRMGYRAGTPDIIVDEPRGVYHGLRIEMKTQSGGTVSPEQKQFIAALNERGYFAVVCHGAIAAIATINNYMGGTNGNDSKTNQS